MIVCLGDSITYGQHLTPDKAWPQLLDIQEVVPAGVPGDTTRLGLERFPKDVQALNPEIVIIQFGHNDANRWDTDRGLPRVSLAAYKANLAEMIERVRTFDAQPYLCSLTPTTRSSHFAADCEIYDRVLRGIAIDEDVPLIDVWAAFTGPTGRGVGRVVQPGLLMEDGLHLTEMGHRVYAEIVQAALNGVFIQ